MIDLQVNTQNLERMRKVKTRHQRLYARVETVREELQRFLEDDDDMAKMCLTRKKELERMVSSGPGGATLKPYPASRLHAMLALTRFGLRRLYEGGLIHINIHACAISFTSLPKLLIILWTEHLPPAL